MLLLLTGRFTASEAFCHLCDAHQVDRLATAAAIDPAHFVDEGEIARVAELFDWLHEDGLALERARQELQTLSQHLADAYEELNLLYNLSANMLVNRSPVQFLTEACEQLLEVVGLRWMALQLAHEAMPLEELAGRLITVGAVEAESALLRDVGRELLGRQTGTSRPIVADDVGKLHIPNLERLGTNLLVVPLARSGRTFGILYGCDKLDGSPLSSVDSKLCNSLASTLAIFIENTMLYEDVQAMFVGTLHALTSSIDAKDSYTHGHSERVALVSRMLAQAAGMDDQRVERIYLSGLVHDVGKIGVPEAVLCKPGALTEEEFELVKQHSVIGARILQDIRQMSDLIPGVLYHHERWDGRGYPEGRAAEDIPMFGRVLGLADAFDAMSSNRTYRRARAPDVVRAEIRRCAGTQFDPDLARVFVDLDLTPYFDLILIHQKQHQLMQQRGGLEG